MKRVDMAGCFIDVVFVFVYRVFSCVFWDEAQNTSELLIG